METLEPAKEDGSASGVVDYCNICRASAEHQPRLEFPFLWSFLGQGAWPRPDSVESKQWVKRGKNETTRIS